MRRSRALAPRVPAPLISAITLVDPATVNLTRVDKNAVIVAATTTQTIFSSLVVLVVMTTETHRKEKSRYIRLHPPPQKKTCTAMNYVSAAPIAPMVETPGKLTVDR